MARFGDPVKPYWPEINTRRQEFLCISEPTSWVSHWEVREKRARRCGGPGCLQCAKGMQKQLRVVIMCVDNSGRDALIELRERHREKLDAYESTVGLVLELKRAGTAGNSPVDLKVLGSRSAVERDIKALVAVFGLAPLVGDVSGALDRAGEQLINRQTVFVDPQPEKLNGDEDDEEGFDRWG